MFVIVIYIGHMLFKGRDAEENTKLSGELLDRKICVPNLVSEGDKVLRVIKYFSVSDRGNFHAKLMWIVTVR